MLMKSFRYFALRASGLELISSMRLDDREEMQSVKPAKFILQSELRANILPSLKAHSKVREKNSECLVVNVTCLL